jgi:hypothetical protein
MQVVTFMWKVTFYETPHIHATHITCFFEHSCSVIHYMGWATFMLPLTLHEGGYIHASGNITCVIPHSCKSLHYMQAPTFITNSLAKGINKGIGPWHPAHCIYEVTFMGRGTLHAYPNIHAITNITCRYLHSWRYLHYMPQITFMRWVTLHARTDIHEKLYITWYTLHSCAQKHYMSPWAFMHMTTLHAAW